MQAITILTLNPALDITYQVPALVADQKNRATATRYDPGGNGINVSQALLRLALDAVNHCVVAGEIGALLQRLLEGQVGETSFHPVRGETTINATVLTADDARQYEVIGIGPRVPATTLARIQEAFLLECGRGYGVLTGSLPPESPPDTYARLVERLQDQGGRAVVDARPELLAPTLAARPFLVKPSRYELEQLLGRRLPDLGTVAGAARELRARGVTWVCASLGAQGALLAGPDGCWHATPPAIEVASTVGAGDSMVAGLVAGFATGRNPADALRLGIACGSGTASQPGTELFDPADLPGLQDKVQVRPLPE